MAVQRICIVSPNKDVYSETFIRAHIEQLPMKVTALFGYPLPGETGDGVSLYSNGLGQRLLNYAGNKFFGYENGWIRQRNLIKFMKHNKIEVVLAEYGHTGVAVMDVCQEANIPLVVHFHGHDAYHANILENEGKKYPELFSRADALVVVSKDMHQQLINLGAPSEKIFINPCGVDVSKFDGAEPGNSDPIFISVGRFVDKKAPQLTILAFNEVLKSNSDARLKMIGDGPLLEACMQIADALGIVEFVEFRGPLPHEEVVNQLRSARVFIQHSMRTKSGDSEGTPVGILEASAAGLPIIATRHTGIKDIVIEGETGFLVDEGDIHGMANAMVNLSWDQSLAAQLGKNGRDFIVSNYSMKKSITNLSNIIESATLDHIS